MAQQVFSIEQTFSIEKENAVNRGGVAPYRDKRLHTLLIKPAGAFCNLRCDYCFYLDRHRLYPGHVTNHRMTEATLARVIESMFAASEHPFFVWQGGEPTVMGLDFYRQAVALQRRYAQGRPFANALQTHGGLLDGAWAEFLRQENFLVGLSLDGPQPIHDRYRRDPRGQGTFTQTLAAAQLLLTAKVPVNALVTVSEYAAHYPEQIYRFLRDAGLIFMQFSPLVEADPKQPERAAEYSVTATSYGHFLWRLFRAWWQDFDFERLRQATSIRFFDSILQRYLGMEPDHCALHRHCNDYLVVEHNGDLFSCDFLVDETTRLGNVHRQTLPEAFYSPAHLAFGARKAAYGKTCRHCPWLAVCHGGCIKDRIRDPQDGGHNRFCAAYRYFFPMAHRHFLKLAELYRLHYLKQP